MYNVLCSGILSSTKESGCKLYFKDGSLLLLSESKTEYFGVLLNLGDVRCTDVCGLVSFAS